MNYRERKVRKYRIEKSIVKQTRVAIISVYEKLSRDVCDVKTAFRSVRVVRRENDFPAVDFSNGDFQKEKENRWWGKWRRA